MSVVVGVDKNSRVRFVGGSCKARDMRSEITEIKEFLERSQ